MINNTFTWSKTYTTAEWDDFVSDLSYLFSSRINNCTGKGELGDAFLRYRVLSYPGISVDVYTGHSDDMIDPYISISDDDAPERRMYDAVIYRDECKEFSLSINGSRLTITADPRVNICLEMLLTFQPVDTPEAIVQRCKELKNNEH